MTRAHRNIGLFGAFTALALLAGCHDDSNNVTGPQPLPATTPIPTARPMQTPTPAPPSQPTPAPPSQAATVTVGAGGGFSFADQQSGTSTTTVRVGDSVRWTWASGPHSTTSGSCSGAGCQPSGLWDSGTGSNGMTFSRTFTQAGNFPYFCTVHGAMMQGTVVVH